MRLFPVDAFIGFAKRTDAIFNVFHKPISQPVLLFPGLFANWTSATTEVSHFSIFISYVHLRSPSHFAG
jgi:hypothetical protein